MSEPVQVSVVIATRNRRGFLAEAIASVLAQDYRAWELVVVDDSSTDDTVEFLRGLSHPAIVTILLDGHPGRSAARNAGLAAARGELVMFLDDDDLLRPQALSVLAPPLLEDAEAVASVGRRYRFEGTRGSAIPHPSRPMRLRVVDDLLCGWGSVSGQNLYRTAAVRAVGGYEAWPVCEDRDLWLKVASLGPVLTRPEIVLDYRVHGGQSTKEGVEAVRARVFAAYIATLPPGQRRRARRLQKSGEDRWRAHLLSQQRRRLPAFLLAVRSILRRPSVVRSPLLSRVMRDVFRATIPGIGRVLRRLGAR